MRLMHAALLFCSLPCAASAQNSLKIAIGQPGSWDTSAVTLGVNAKIFQKHGVAPDLLYTQGSGETLQAVISHAVSIGVGAGSLGALSALSKAAPIRIVAGTSTGSGNFWFVKSDSPIKSPSDLNDKTVAISTTGSSTHIVALTVMSKFGVHPKLVSTGSVPATLVAVMSGQVDVGFSFMPVGLDDLNKGSIRILFKDNDFDNIRNQTIRVTVAHTSDADGPGTKAFVEAYAETVDWMYTDDSALKAFADLVHISVDDAHRIRDNFYPREVLDPYRFEGARFMVDDALRFKFITKPMDEATVASFLSIPRKGR